MGKQALDQSVNYGSVDDCVPSVEWNSGRKKVSAFIVERLMIVGREKVSLNVRSKHIEW
jgi:hypothetical protein